jgi:hypothetical protein
MDTRHLIRFSNTKALQQIPGVLPKTNKPSSKHPLRKKKHKPSSSNPRESQTKGKEATILCSAYRNCGRRKACARRAAEEELRRSKSSLVFPIHKTIIFFLPTTTTLKIFTHIRNDHSAVDS